MNKTDLIIISMNSCKPGMPGPQRTPEIASAFAKRGMNVVVYISSQNYFGNSYGHKSSSCVGCKGAERYVELWAIKRLFNTRVVLQMINSLLFIAAATLKLALDKKVRRKETLIILSTPPFIVASMMCVLLRALGYSKIALDIRDIWPKSLFEFSGLRPHSLVGYSLLKMEKMMLKGIALLISPLNNISQYYFETAGGSLTSPLPQTVILPNGISSNEYDSLANIRVLNDWRGRRQPRLYYIGKANRSNGIIDLLKIHSDDAFKGTELHIVGPSEYDTSFYARYPRVHYHGMYSKQHLTNAYESADILVCYVPDREIYRYGLSPNKYPEYLASGKPVLYILPEGVHLKNNPWPRATSGDMNTVISAFHSIKSFSESDLDLLSVKSRQVAKSMVYPIMLDDVVEQLRLHLDPENE